MFLKSVKGLHEAIQETPYYKSRRPSIKPVLVDKCNFLINAIIEGNRHVWNIKDFTEVPLHRNILRAQLGKPEDKIILNLLEELDIITINHSYISTPYVAKINASRKKKGLPPQPIKAESKKYGLTDKAKELGVLKVGVLSERMEKKLVKYKSDLLKSYLQDKQIHQKIIYNTTELKFNTDKGLKALNNVLSTSPGTDKANHFKECFDNLTRINQYKSIDDYVNCPDYYYTQSKLVKRVFHYYGNIPKQFRESLYLNGGGALSEIDLKNSQPLIIGLNYINRLLHPHNIIEHKEGNKGEREGGGICGYVSPLEKSDQLLYSDIISGNFYNRVAEQAKKNNDTNLYNLFTNDYSQFKAKVLGKGLYFNLMPEDEVKEPERYLTQLYPNFMNHIRETKKKQGYKSISINAQRIESSIFINDLFISLEHGKEFAVPVHDSIIVKTEEVEQFLYKLVGIFCSKFNFMNVNQVNNLFRITKY